MVGLAGLTQPVQAASQTATQKAPILVVLWFDTEDYIFPPSDDACLRLATWLKSQGIKATFKVVGEKARVLKERGRQDVIDAVKWHEVGFHSTNHSIPPSPAMYLNAVGWEEGIQEFERREGKGRKMVEEIFGAKPSCYGQPGSSWGPQAYPVLAKWDMIYLDSGRHVSLKGEPCRINGVLNLYSLEHTFRADLKKPEGAEEAQKRFSQARDKILAQGGGLISIVYHPCEFVHQTFWDGVNFPKGASPDRSEWKLPARKKPEEEALAWKNFEDFILMISRHPEVKFITANQAREWYADQAREKSWTQPDLRSVLNEMGADPLWVEKDGVWLSAAEVFDLTVQATLARWDRATGPWKPRFHLHGPSTAPATRLEKSVTAPGHLVRQALEDLKEQLDQRGAIPPAVWLGSTAIPPESFLAGLRLRWMNSPGEGPWTQEAWEFPPARVKSEDAVEKNDGRLWNWVIFPEGFRAPQVMEMARRQAWTFKPAPLVKKN